MLPLKVILRDLVDLGKLVKWVAGKISKWRERRRTKKKWDVVDDFNDTDWPLF